MVERAKRADKSWKLLGKFLRLAEFEADGFYDDLYARAGGTVKERHAFLQHLVDNRYISLATNGTLAITSHGRRTSRLLMRSVPSV